jgi:Tol biopolymer transport system component/tRNA A-37 threonylcarbamoyl transferase component Bud32
MSPQRWKKVQELAAGALELEASEVSIYLHSQSGADESLVEDVLSLLRNSSSEDLSILKTGACALGFDRLFAPGPALAAGQVLCERFVVTQFIDAGGMGEVYSAWDRELGCAVALKTIRGHPGPAALERFRNEVVRARQISHPNVCRVYDLFQDDRPAGTRLHFLTMELLAGPNLAQYVQGQGKLEADRALVILTQIADGLSAAHRRGIIHRDLKPGNVMLVEEESGTRAVITDFGLALPMAALAAENSSVHASGTAAYMAPEQISGGVVSAATDVYAFGVLTRTILKESVLHDRIAGIRQTWESWIGQCTEPDPARRIASGIVLRDTLVHRKTGRIVWYIAATVVLSIAAVLSAGYVFRERNLRLAESVRLTQYSGLATSGTTSDNGRVIAYASDEADPGNLDIWVRDLDSGVSRRITTDPAEELYPKLSPDGSWVIYRSERNGGGLYAAPVHGGPEFLVAAGGCDAVFSPDGKRIAFWIGEHGNLSVNGSKVYVMDFPRGTPQPLHPEFADARLPVWSPDGRSILFLGVKEGELPPDAAADWWVTQVADPQKLRATGLQPHLRKQKLLLHNGVEWWRNYLIFAATQGDATNIWYTKLNSRGESENSLKRLTTSTDSHFVPSLSRDGRLVYSTLRAQIGTLEVNLTDPNADPRFITSSVGNDTYTSLSANGSLLSFRRRISGFRNVWLKDLRTGRESALTNSATEKLQPAISPDGTTVAWSQTDGPAHSVFLTRVAGGQTIRLCQACGDVQGWMPDGDRVITASGLDGTALTVSVKTGRRETLLDSRDYLIDSIRCSPDGQRLVFVGRSGKQAAIYMFAASPLNHATRPDFVRLTDPGSWSDAPAWSTDGQAIFFRSERDGHYCIWSVAVPKLSERSLPVPRIVHHFHSYQAHLDAFPRSGFAISAWDQRLYLTGADMRGTVWMTRIQEP